MGRDPKPFGSEKLLLILALGEFVYLIKLSFLTFN